MPVNKFIFPRLEPELEDRFRMETLAQDKRQLRVVLVLSLVITIGFIALDLCLRQNGDTLQISTAIRCLAAVVSLWALWMIRHLSSIRLFDRIVFVWLMSVFCHVLTVNMLRPTDYFAVIVWDLIVIYGAYVLVPVPLHLQMLAALLLTAGSVVLWLVYRLPLADTYETVAVLAAYTFTNIWGIFSSRRLNRSHRQQFVLLVQETDLRKKLETALSEVKVLRGIIPICSFCKKIRNDDGYYEAVEAYIRRHSAADFSHTLCPGCFEVQYPDVYKILKENGSIGDEIG